LINNWPVWAVLVFNGGPLLLGVAGIAYSLYLRRHLDAMMKALSNSRYIYIWGPSLRKKGMFGCLLLIAKIAGMVMMPKASIRIGELDPIGVENFPAYLKRLLKVKAFMLVGSGVWLLVASLLVEFKL